MITVFRRCSINALSSGGRALIDRNMTSIPRDLFTERRMEAR